MSVYRCIAGPQHRLAFLDHLAPLSTKNLYFFFQFLKPVPLFTCFYCDAHKKRKKTGMNSFIYQPLEQDNQVLFSYSTFLGHYLAKGEKRSRKFALQTQIHHCYLLFIIPVPFFIFLLVHCLGLAWCTQFTTPLAILLVYCWGIVLFTCFVRPLVYSRAPVPIPYTCSSQLYCRTPDPHDQVSDGEGRGWSVWRGVSGEWVPGRESEWAEGRGEWLVGTVSGGLTPWRGTERV